MNPEEKIFIINPPEGCEFRECISCSNPFLWDKEFPSTKCIWCEINMEDQEK